jgi:NAD-dependent dihydropyrimidine dehydrogenase PreA subunit
MTTEPQRTKRSEPRGQVEIDWSECKGCGLCIHACPPGCLRFAKELSGYGVHPAEYTGTGCTGCGICFYCCPEPGAITVYRVVVPSVVAAHVEKEPGHAAAL